MREWEIGASLAGPVDEVVVVVDDNTTGTTGCPLDRIQTLGHVQKRLDFAAVQIHSFDEPRVVRSVPHSLLVDDYACDRFVLGLCYDVYEVRAVIVGAEDIIVAREVEMLSSRVVAERTCSEWFAVLLEWRAVFLDFCDVGAIGVDPSKRGPPQVIGGSGLELKMGSDPT